MGNQVPALTTDDEKRCHKGGLITSAFPQILTEFSNGALTGIKDPPSLSSFLPSPSLSLTQTYNLPPLFLNSQQAVEFQAVSLANLSECFCGESDSQYPITPAPCGP